MKVGNQQSSPTLEELKNKQVFKGIGDLRKDYYSSPLEEYFTFQPSKETLTKEKELDKHFDDIEKVANQMEKEISAKNKALEEAYDKIKKEQEDTEAQEAKKPIKNSKIKF